MPRAAVLTLVLVACGPASDLVDHDAAPGLRDVRVPLPAPQEDTIALVTPELVIEPGADKMMCVHLENDRGDLAIDTVNGIQGAYGHHIALFSSSDPQPPGTVVDCTSAEANATLRWVAFNVTFPAGDALRIPAGMPYVIQFHYINAGDMPILVRDVYEMHRVAPGSVHTWVSTMMANDLDITVGPGASTVSWDCVIPDDRDLLQLFGHMHEHGASYTIDLSGERIYTVDPWEERFRDAPRVVSYFDHPLHIAAGATLRTTCSWHNTGPTLHYPAEMCTTFAYVASDAPYTCMPSVPVREVL